MNVTELLKRYAQRWPEEAHVVDRFMELIRSVPDALLRSALAGHITASAWVVDISGDLVLLTHHKKLGIWVQLGGHVDGEPNVLSVALKEASEESGITQLTPMTSEIFDIDIHPIPATSTVPEHLHFDIRFVVVAESMQYTVSDESHDLAWVRIDELLNYNSEVSMLRMASKWKDLQHPSATDH